MGIPLYPELESWCEWDNPYFPPGKVPFRIQVRYDGIMRGPAWQPWMGNPLNGKFVYEQITESTWGITREGLMGYVNFSPLGFEVVNLYGVGGITHFLGQAIFVPFTRKQIYFDNTWTGGEFEGGMAALRWRNVTPDIASLGRTAELVGVPLQPKTFAEIINYGKYGVTDRIAHKPSGTKIRITFEEKVPEMIYVDRGDPNYYDHEKPAFITDNTWRDLSLADAVPAGAELVLIRFTIQSSSATGEALFRKKGNVSFANKSSVYINNPGKNEGRDILVSVDADRRIQYKISSIAFNHIYLSVAGWWILA